MTPQDHSHEFRDLLRARVGGFLRNTRREPGVTCSVCCVPTSADLCAPCQDQRGLYGDQLANRVVTLTYVRGNAPRYHQSAYLIRTYKQPPEGAKSAEDVALLITAATYIHASCGPETLGSPWTAVTYVPSVRAPGPEHPVAGLARRVVGMTVRQRFTLELGPGATNPARSVRPDQFAVNPRLHDRVSGQHALIVDDTWVSGSKAQSAALAVRSAGAETITIMCVARWCKNDWPDHRAFLDSCIEPYDAFVCPFNNPDCPHRDA